MFGPRLEHTPESKRWHFFQSLFFMVAFLSRHQYVKLWMDKSPNFSLSEDHFDTLVVLVTLCVVLFSFFALQVQLRIFDLFMIVTFAALLLTVYRTAGLQFVFPICMTLGGGSAVMFFYRMKPAGIKPNKDLSAAKNAQAEVGQEAAGGK